MAIVEDIKPSTHVVLDTKPKPQVFDTKPSEVFALKSTIDFTSPITLGAGMPIGLLLTITYPTSITIN